MSVTEHPCHCTRLFYFVPLGFSVLGLQSSLINCVKGRCIIVMKVEVEVRSCPFEAQDPRCVFAYWLLTTFKICTPRCA